MLEIILGGIGFVGVIIALIWSQVLIWGKILEDLEERHKLSEVQPTLDEEVERQLAILQGEPDLSPRLQLRRELDAQGIKDLPLSSITFHNGRASVHVGCGCFIVGGSPTESPKLVAARLADAMCEYQAAKARREVSEAAPVLTS